MNAFKSVLIKSGMLIYAKPSVAFRLHISRLWLGEMICWFKQSIMPASLPFVPTVLLYVSHLFFDSLRVIIDANEYFGG